MKLQRMPKLSELKNLCIPPEMTGLRHLSKQEKASYFVNLK